MPRVVVFGTGKSSPYLIKKLQESSELLALQITLISPNLNELPKDCLQHKNTVYANVPITEKETINKIVIQQDLVISMLPAHLHLTIAKLCITHEKDLLTASYVDSPMQALHKKAKQKGLLFLNEMGVDPGLDHMSAQDLIQKLQKQDARITGFYSHTGGLTNTTQPNGWNYKFTWNPKNVIVAGSEGALYIKNQQKKTVPYLDLFTDIIPVSINTKKYDSYPNRNSLVYAQKYHLEHIQNFYRGTLRHQGYCEAWNAFVQLGLTNNTSTIELSKLATRKDFLNYFLSTNTDIETAFCKHLTIEKTSPIVQKFKTLGFFNEEKKLRLTKGTPAEILLQLLKQDWQMLPNEKDLLVMQHQINYTLNNIAYSIKSELSVVGEDQHYTAMAKTVGAPMFEAALMMLNKQLPITGVQTPIQSNIYQPLLKRIQNHDLKFTETTIRL